jgi:hypothetical protein
VVTCGDKFLRTSMTADSVALTAVSQTDWYFLSLAQAHVADDCAGEHTSEEYA